MDEKEALGKVAYEARRAFYYETRMEAATKPWEKLDEEAQQSWIASGEAVANYVKRDMAAMQFSAFVAFGGMDLEQRVTELEEGNARNAKEIERLLTLLQAVQAGVVKPLL